MVVYKYQIFLFFISFFRILTKVPTFFLFKAVVSLSISLASIIEKLKVLSTEIFSFYQPEDLYGCHTFNSNCFRFASIICVTQMIFIWLDIEQSKNIFEKDDGLYREVKVIKYSFVFIFFADLVKYCFYQANKVSLFSRIF